MLAVKRLSDGKSNEGDTISARLKQDGRGGRLEVLRRLLWRRSTLPADVLFCSARGEETPKQQLLLSRSCTQPHESERTSN